MSLKDKDKAKYKAKRTVRGEVRHEKETKRVIRYHNGTIVKEHVREKAQQSLSWQEQVEVWEQSHQTEMKDFIDKARSNLFVTRSANWYAQQLQKRAVPLLDKYAGSPILSVYLKDVSSSMHCLRYHGPLMVLLEDLWRNQIWDCMSAFTEAQLEGKVPQQEKLVLAQDSWAKRVNLGQVSGILTNLVLDYLQSFPHCHHVKTVPEALETRDHVESLLGQDAQGRHVTRLVMDYANVSLVKRLRCIDHFDFLHAFQRLKRQEVQVDDVLTAAEMTCDLLLSERMQPVVEEAVLLSSVDPENQHVDAHLLDIVDCSIPITRDNNVKIHVQIGAKKLRYITMSHWAILALNQWRPAAQQAFETHTAAPLRKLGLKESVSQAYLALLLQCPQDNRIQFLTPSAKHYFESLENGKEALVPVASAAPAAGEGKGSASTTCVSASVDKAFQ